MYRKIVSLKSVPTIYQDILLASEVITQNDVEAVEAAVAKELDEALEAADTGYTPPPPPMKDEWQEIGYSGPALSVEDISPPTGISKERLIEVGKASVTVPEDFVR